MSYFKASPLKIQGALIVENERHEDDRGLFEMTYHAEFFKEVGLPTEWAQDNNSVNLEGVLRGMHVQTNKPQAKLLRCLYGVIYDVLLDLRPESSTYKQWQGLFLDWRSPKAIYIPEGCAHGLFCVSSMSVVNYKCSSLYDKASDGGVHWGSAGIDWPFDVDFTPIVSPKDQVLPTVDDYIKSLS